jgi:hypothetical protein
VSDKKENKVSGRGVHLTDEQQAENLPRTEISLWNGEFIGKIGSSGDSP